MDSTFISCLAVCISSVTFIFAIYTLCNFNWTPLSSPFSREVSSRLRSSDVRDIQLNSSDEIRAKLVILTNELEEPELASLLSLAESLHSLKLCSGEQNIGQFLQTTYRKNGGAV